jgi:hypothetical protein
MAELKGLMLSLSRLYTSPRELLVNANRIIAQHLDARSFITDDLRGGRHVCAHAHLRACRALSADLSAWHRSSRRGKGEGGRGNGH